MMQPEEKMMASSADQIAAFMAKNLFTCQLLAARITPEQCARNRSSSMFSCSKCTQEYPMPGKAIAKPKRSKAAESKSPWRKQLYDRVELAEHEAAAAEPVQPKAEESRPVPTKAAQSGSKQVKAGQVGSGQVRSGQVRAGAPRHRRRHPSDPAPDGPQIRKSAGTFDSTGGNMLNAAIAEMGAATRFATEVDRLLEDNRKLRAERAELLMEVGRLRERLRQRTLPIAEAA